MDATAWTVVGAAIAILVAVGASFRSLRDEMRAQVKELRAQGDDLRASESTLRARACGSDTTPRATTCGSDTRLRGTTCASGSTLRGTTWRKRIDAQGEQMGLLRERMAHLEGLLAGLREAITKRVA